MMQNHELDMDLGLSGKKAFFAISSHGIAPAGSSPAVDGGFTEHA